MDMYLRYGGLPLYHCSRRRVRLLPMGGTMSDVGNSSASREGHLAGEVAGGAAAEPSPGSGQLSYTPPDSRDSNPKTRPTGSTRPSGSAISSPMTRTTVT